MGVAGHVGDTRGKLQLKTTVFEHKGSKGGVSDDILSGNMSTWEKKDNSGDTREKLQFRTTGSVNVINVIPLWTTLRMTRHIDATIDIVLAKPGSSTTQRRRNREVGMDHDNFRTLKK